MKRFINISPVFIFGFIFMVIVILSSWYFITPIIEKKRAERIVDVPESANTDSMTLNYLQRLYNEAVKDPSSGEKLGRLAMAYHSNYFYDRACVCYRLAAEYDNNNWQWPYYHGLIKEEIGDSKASIDHLKETVRINGKITQAWLRLANQYIKLSDYEKAKDAYMNVLRLPVYFPEGYTSVSLPNKGSFPLDAYASLGLARIELFEKKIQSAKTKTEQLITNYPDFGPGYRLLGQIYYELNDKELGDENTVQAGDFASYVPPADPVFDQLVLSSHNAAFILKEARLALLNQNFEWAEILSNLMIKRNIDKGEAYANLIRLAVITYDFSEMNDLVEKHYRMISESETKLIKMGEFLSQARQFRNASRYLSKAILLNEKSVKARMAYLNILIDVGYYDKAKVQVKEIQKIDPANEDAMIKSGIISYLEKRKQAASGIFKRVLELNPENEIAMIWLGMIAKDEKNTNRALYYFSRSIKTNPNNSNTWMLRGDYLEELRRWDEAVENFNEALQLSPNNINYLQRYSWLLSASPDAEIRNGKLSLKIARRLSLVKKDQKEQNISCGMSLAAAYAEEGQFEKAAAITARLINYSKKIRTEQFIPQLKQMQKVFEENRAYRVE